MAYPKPYELADETIVLLNKLTLRYFNIVKNRLIVSGFDELNVMREVNGLYTQVLVVIKRNFRKLWCDDYIEWLIALGAEERDREFVNRIAGEAMTGLLETPNPVTKYTFESEYLRRQQRCVESVIAAQGSVNKQIEMDRALKSVSTMVKEYALLTEDDSTVQSMKDCGVKKVRWNAEHDKRTCHTCEDLDGQVFDIDRIPVKPHSNCRCWLTPA